MTSPVLVMGASGTVGLDVVRGLHAAGVPVRAALRHPPGPITPSAGLSSVRFDVTDRTSWPAALDGVAAMFLMRPPEIVAVGRDLLPFVDAAVAAGVTRVVFLSVQGAQRSRAVPHRRVERHLEASGAQWTFLRASYFLQNLLTVHCEEIRERGEIAVPAGSGRTAFVDTRDIAEVAVVALTGPGHERRAYELTGPRASTYAEVAAVLTEVLDHPVRYTDPSLLAYARERYRRGMPLPLVLTTLALYTVARLGLAGRTTPQLATLLGRPPTDLRRFAGDHAARWNR